MSKTLILNPNDQPTGKWRLINELRASLSDPDFDTLRIAVAFAKTGPLYRLQPEIEAWRKQKKVIEGIFGIDHCGTSRQALEFALAKFSKVRLLHFDGRFTFHPKMYLFSGPKRCRFYIGSHNLTVGGTETNWESGTSSLSDLAKPSSRSWPNSCYAV
jgi:HKD family nuclease